MVNRRHAAQSLSHLFPAANDNARHDLAAMVPHGAVENLRYLRYEGAIGLTANTDTAQEAACRMRRYLATTAVSLIAFLALAAWLLPFD